MKFDVTISQLRVEHAARWQSSSFFNKFTTKHVKVYIFTGISLEFQFNVRHKPQQQEQQLLMSDRRCSHQSLHILFDDLNAIKPNTSEKNENNTNLHTHIPTYICSYEHIHTHKFMQQ